MSQSDQTIWYGSQSAPERIRLNAGDLEMVYEQGFLRYIKSGENEILRMINHLVRDHNWGTVPQRIFDEQIEKNEHSFSIWYKCEAMQGGIHFLSECHIQGSENNELIFNYSGEAKSRFRKNRIGFTILHPIKECAGKQVVIGHNDREPEKLKFPDLISPHQSFFDIQSMEWKVGNQTATLEFEGDVFEIEDQRNWTDDSYKTYAPPLGLPFPAQMEPGDKIEQTITLCLEGKPKENKITSASWGYSLGNQGFQLPKLGVGRSTEIESLSDTQVASLKVLQFDHYRIDLRLGEPGWKELFAKASDEAYWLGYALEIGAFFTDDSTEVLEFIKILNSSKVKISLINVYDTSAKSIQQKTINRIIPELKRAFPDTRIGGGTDAFFTELNRDNPQPDLLDFLVYSINPQVHAFDNDSLVETLNVQHYTVDTARSFSGGKPIHISPITLKMRWNPNATGTPEVIPGQLPDDVDPRQMSLFGAGWTLGSLNALLESQPNSLTFYETVGLKGIIQSSKPLFNDLFITSANEKFPVYFLLKILLENKDKWFYPINPNQPGAFTGLAYGNKNEVEGLLLASFKEETLIISLDEVLFGSKCKVLDSQIMPSLMKGELDLADIKEIILDKQISLPPFGLCFISTNRN